MATRTLTFEQNENGTETLAYRFPNMAEALKFAAGMASNDDGDQCISVNQDSKEKIEHSPVPSAPILNKADVARIKTSLLAIRGSLSAKVISSILASPKNAVSDEHLRATLKDESGTPLPLAPLFSAISKTLKRNDLVPADLYDKQPRRSNGKLFMWYRLRSAAVAALSEIEDFENGSPVGEIASPFDDLFN